MNSETLWKTAQRLIPGGVNSPVRAFGQVGGTPRFIVRAEGCRLEDVDGKHYIDYVAAWGPLILGHAPASVVDALHQAATDGSAFGMPTPGENELAALLVERVPTLDMVRLVNSGTEAAMSALRLARAVTGRRYTVKFSGGYHGHVDALLANAGSGMATLALPASPGVDAASAETTLVARYNDLDSVSAHFDHRGHEIAAIIVEPVAGNMGVVPPAAGFLSGLQHIAQTHGTLLIFDEVMTGFRVGPGGAQQRFEITPHLTILGKIMGGGLPVGAYGGRRDLLEQLAPNGPVYQAGTLSGNPLTVAAGLATLRQLRPADYDHLETLSARLAQGIESACAQTSTTACVQRVGSMLTLFFGRSSVSDFDDASAADHQRYARFFHAMLERGVHLPPSGYEAWFVSLAHDKATIDWTIEQVADALDAID
jgi:glutamate-1-semialdehyde 2,1-aminomutase